MQSIQDRANRGTKVAFRSEGIAFIFVDYCIYKTLILHNQFKCICVASREVHIKILTKR